MKTPDRSAIRWYAAAAILIAGCSGIRPGRDPEGTFNSARKAILEDNFESLWGLVGERARDAEATRIREQQRQVQATLKNMTPADKEQFLNENGISPDDYVNLSPAGAFAANIRNSKRVSAGLREALLDSSVSKSKIDDDTAELVISIPGERDATVRFVREHGLWRIPSMQDFFMSLRLSGRITTAGKTPRETYEALLACISARAYDRVWDLLSDDHQASLARTYQKGLDQVKLLKDDRKREFERHAGISVEEYLKLPPAKLLALELALKYKDPSEMEVALSRQVDKITPTGDIATISLVGADGKNRIRLKKQGDRWYLMGF